MKFYEKLIKLRKEKGISQEEFGNELNISRQAVSKWELGESKPDIDKVKKIAQFYGVSFEYLLNDELEKEETTKRKNNKINIIFVILFIIFSIYIIECLSKSILFSYVLSKNNLNNISSYKYSSENESETYITTKNVVKKDKLTYVEEFNNYDKDYYGSFKKTWFYKTPIERTYYEINTKILVDNGVSLEDKDYWYLEKGDANVEEPPFKIINDIKKEFNVLNILNPFKIYNINKDKNIEITLFLNNNKYEKNIYYIDIFTGYLSKYEYWNSEKLLEVTRYHDISVNNINEEDLKFNDEIKNEIIEKDKIHLYPYLGKVLIEDFIEKIEISTNDTNQIKIENLNEKRIFRAKINNSNMLDIQENENMIKNFPIITVYLEDGEKYKIGVLDNYTQDSNSVIAIWKEEDEANKCFYKLNNNLNEWILSLEAK